MYFRKILGGKPYFHDPSHEMVLKSKSVLNQIVIVMVDIPKCLISERFVIVSNLKIINTSNILMDAWLFMIIMFN